MVNLKKMMLACFASKVDAYLVDSKSVIEGCEEGVKLVWRVSVSVSSVAGKQSAHCSSSFYSY